MVNQPLLEDFIAKTDKRVLALGLAILLALTGVILGIALALLGPIYTVIILGVIAGGIWLIADIEYALWGVIAIISLLPFATLPFKIVITPTFLDLTLGVVFFLYLMQWMTGQRRRLISTPIHPLIILFIVLAIFSFVAGLRYAGLTSRVLRSFAELLLSISLAIVLVDILRTPAQVKRFTYVLLLIGAAAALIGIGLWLMPDRLAESTLSRLSIIGYPAGGVIQYIEQNPELPERAIGTAVNPNSLGGYLVMVAALAAPQLSTRYPLFEKRWMVFPVLGALVICLILTFSRGSLLAFVLALVLISTIRYRKLLIVLTVLALLFLLLPWTQFYVTRLLEGFQGADLATQMRFGEYKDALILLQRYPVLGVGFAGTPDIDIYLGVANVYLTIASNMGLLGLGAFLTLMGSLFVYAWRARKQVSMLPGLYPIWLGAIAGLAGALFNGMLDHYFFNLEFHHAITVFWLFVGLLLAVTRVSLEAAEDSHEIATVIIADHS